ncbi:low molecular weight phosphatase family protein [Mycolicibacterium austroafricanum]|uniref:arsenate reductase/protein-tyrosine-phosphatase family protein n=1 Tax=Mycolicibacterium austroafricanum TaxID=39687 RepID=UPI001ABF9E6F|nr:low molecular weight phosphatase family protein [Mycolicibacterium austroafricanum]QRZ08338.1 low molecular weight phosphatase family protein [Mycolicibacterium austroafricanum]QZT69991.1 low molecular weight phosphatase family protein [Mycolicibacterium austroafricanum]
MKLLFVCTGNICRSPVAERLATAYGARHGVPNWSASSAGTRAVIRSPMHPEAASVLQRLGGDPSGFLARQLSAKIALGADLVLTMTAQHRDRVLELAPSLMRRTFTLSEASHMASEWSVRSVAEMAELRSQIDACHRLDIADPIGQAPDVFNVVMSQIAQLTQPIFEICLHSSNRSEA